MWLHCGSFNRNISVKEDASDELRSVLYVIRLFLEKDCKPKHTKAPNPRICAGMEAFCFIQIRNRSCPGLGQHEHLR